MITEHRSDTGELPTTTEGWIARSKYFESLWKIEKLTSAKLRLTNRHLTDYLYGRSSEKLTDAQRVLFGLEAAPAPLSDQARELLKEAQRGIEDTDAADPKRKGGGRRKDRFQNLPEVVSRIDPPEEDRRGMVRVREELTEHVEIEPAIIFRHVIVRGVYAHPRRERPPIIAPLPAEARVFPGSRYGLRFMVRAITGKYADHLPLYRIWT